MDMDEILEGLSYNERRLLLSLQSTGGSSAPGELVSENGFGLEVEVMGAASWLASKGLVTIDEDVSRFFIIGDTSVIADGLPERRAIVAIDAVGGRMEMGELAKYLPDGEDKIAVGWLKRKGLADIVRDGDSKLLILTDNGRATLNKKMDDEILLERMSNGPIPESEADGRIIKDLKGRQNMISEELVTRRTISLTDNGKEALSKGIELREETVQVTDNLIQSGKWKYVEFRRFDVQTFAPATYPAKKHPLSRLAADVRKLFTEMGFTEYDGEYVHPAFWDLDVLFVPQDHPARDLQDTFYLQNPAKIRVEDDALVDTIRNIHENGGGTGSTGWGGGWSREVAEQGMLRTHTTVNTIQSIAKDPKMPSKVFSLSRIFRKESIDATHLPEFTQIEGYIIDENANFDMLVSIIREFYSRMGFDQIRIRPAYFPYTEPSLELEVFFNGKWMELGGAGIFRKEVMEPFGIDEPVLAWGFGFERLAMLKWGITDIRELYISDMELLRKNRVL